MAKETLKLEKLSTRAQFDKTSFNEKERTVDVVFATETLDVQRYDWRNNTYFIEQLVISPETVRMDRINAGAPFLDNHMSYGSVSNGLGKVVNGSAKIDGNKLRCTVRFSNRAEVAGIMQDVADGILENISVGYSVTTYERQPIIDGETPVYRAIDWEPYEVSLVNIPADINSGVNRSGSNPKGNETEARDVEIDIIDAEGINTGNRSHNQNQPNNNLKSDYMKDLEKRALAVGLPTTATEAEVVAAERKLELTRRAVAVGLAIDASESDIQKAEDTAKRNKENQTAQEATLAERSRQKEIRSLVSTMKLEPSFAEKLIDEGTALESARKLITDEFAKGDSAFRSNITVTGKDEVEKTRDAISAAITIRSNAVASEKITKEEREIAKPYLHRSLLQIAEDCLQRAGVDTKGMDKMEIAGRSITSSTSDFPILLSGTNKRILLDAYKTAPDTWRSFCSVGSVSDFRDWSRLRPGSFTRLDALNENGEYRNKAITDATAEKVKADTYGNTINISRKMIINDDLQAFTSITKGLGRAAARGIEIDAYKLLSLNAGLGPNMSDGLPLFDAAHKNIVTGGGIPSLAQFDKVRILFAKQTEKDNNDYLDLMAALWLGPTELLGSAKTTNESVYDPDSTNKLQRPNFVSNMYTNTIGTPRLTGNPWYSFANPADVPTIEVSFLDGQEAPFMESEIGFDVDGIRWKVRQDYGVGAVDWRGAVYNPGV